MLSYLWAQGRWASRLGLSELGSGAELRDADSMCRSRLVSWESYRFRSQKESASKPRTSGSEVSSLGCLPTFLELFLEVFETEGIQARTTVLQNSNFITPMTPSSTTQLFEIERMLRTSLKVRSSFVPRDRYARISQPGILLFWSRVPSFTSSKIQQRLGGCRSTQMKNRLSFVFLLFTFTVPALAAAYNGAAKNDLDCPSSSAVVFFKDGTQMAIRCYSVRGGTVVMKTREGKLVSVPRTLVDWEATEPGNGHSEVLTKPAAPVANGLIEGAPEDSPEAFHAADRAAERSDGRENTVNATRPGESFMVGDDGGNGESPAFAPTATLAIDPAAPEPPK